MGVVEEGDVEKYFQYQKTTNTIRVYVHVYLQKETRKKTKSEKKIKVS